MTTPSWYDLNATAYAASADSANMAALHQRFLQHLPPGARILDAGCGTGRDAKAFKDAGYSVQAFDLSEEMARRARVLIAQDVGIYGFLDLQASNTFDGVWACASLLHLPAEQMVDALQRLAESLRLGGVIYVSFKAGQGERTKDGRHFTDANEAQLRAWLHGVPSLVPMEIWTTTDTRPGREAERWTNALLKKVTRRLRTGSAQHASRPLLPELCHSIANAGQVDIAVAFVKITGLKLLLPDLQAAIEHRGTRLRFLASDYLGITDPDALRLLMLLQGPTVDVRVYETDGQQSFHLKAYLFAGETDAGAATTGSAYIGSSNISAQALKDGLEWNVRLDYPGDTAYLEARQEFDALFDSPQAKPLSHRWIEDYEARRQPPSMAVAPGSTEREPPPSPNAVQLEALKALNATRQEGYRRGLVVLATGLGKTWLAAFDAKQMGARRVLFVAHREEILQQAAATFVRIQPHARVGYYTGTQRDDEAEMLFASVQTLGRDAHLKRFSPSHFDYVVVDEFHHAAAATYRRLLAHFQPRFLLGLTATPDRTDQADIFALCDDNLVFTTQLIDGIEQGLLVPFRYYGIYDPTVAYEEIPWRSGRFDPEELTNRVATEARAAHVLAQWRLHHQSRTLAFCVSQRHADFMAAYFNQAGVASATVHSASALSRGEALAQLESGALAVVFSVDLFNEGVDLPQIDTVMMLRPTESKILFLQQLGRGLRRAANKADLVVLDFIGNHTSFLNRPQALLCIGSSYQAIASYATQVQVGSLQLPPGCHIQYDIELIEFMQQLARSGEDDVYVRLKAQMGRRPTLLEFFYAGGKPQAVAKGYGSWFALVNAQGDLEPGEAAVFAEHSAFVAALEKESMTKSFKMVLLQAFGELRGWQQPVPLRELAQRSWILLERHRALMAEVEDGVRSQGSQSAAWLAYWRKNPVAAWLGEGRSDPSTAWFELVSNKESLGEAQGGPNMRATFAVQPSQAEALEGMVAEIIDWRMVRFRDAAPDDSSKDGNAESRGLVRGRTAGRQSPIGLDIGAEILRPDVPALFNETFSQGAWNSGHVVVGHGKHHLLFVTLNKQAAAEEHRYVDRWIDDTRFSWQSQNSTTDSGKRGREIIQHDALGITIHLFVRENKIRDGKGCPFVYYGPVRYRSHEGNAPMTVEFELV